VSAWKCQAHADAAKIVARYVDRMVTRPQGPRYKEGGDARYGDQSAVADRRGGHLHWRTNSVSLLCMGWDVEGWLVRDAAKHMGLGGWVSSGGEGGLCCV
jgi:hypothetical protein